MHIIHLNVTDTELNADSAKTLATTAAAQPGADVMVVAWYDGQKQEEHPDVPECQHKPGWLAYAEGHGGQIQVDINNGEFIFIFTDLGEVAE